MTLNIITAASGIAKVYSKPTFSLFKQYKASKITFTMYSADFRKFDSAEVDYSIEGRYGSIKWLKESRSDDFKAIWTYVASLKEKYNINKWFFDKTFESIYPNDDKWKKNELFRDSLDIDSFTKENNLYVAIIMPLNFYTEVVTTEFIKEKSKLEGYNFKIFKSPEEATGWLREQKHVNSIVNN